MRTRPVVPALGVLAGLGALLFGPGEVLEAQEPGEAVLLRALREAPDGPARLVFETDPGVVVCDDGSVRTGGSTYHWGRNRHDRRCQEFEAQVTFSVRDGEVIQVSRPEPTDPSFQGTDMGVAGGPGAGAFFLRVALEGSDRVAERALLPAILARDATVWPELMELARNRSRSSGVRRKAVFWLGQEAAAAVNDELVGLAEDESEDARVRDAAVFALSQRPRDQGVPALMDLVRSSGDPRVRKKAIFWLAQSRDPRVLPFFEEILLEGGGG